MFPRLRVWKGLSLVYTENPQIQYDYMHAFTFNRIKLFLFLKKVQDRSIHKTLAIETIHSKVEMS